MNILKKVILILKFIINFMKVYMHIFLIFNIKLKIVFKKKSDLLVMPNVKSVNISYNLIRSLVSKN